MFRRRLDPTWPLIFVLFGVFLLSLRMPRPWEQIAREASLDLRPHRHAATDQPAISAAAVSEKPLASEDYRVVTPAERIASQAGPVASCGIVSCDAEPSAVVVPATVPELPAAEIAQTSGSAPSEGEAAGAVEHVALPAAGPSLEPPTETSVAAVKTSHDDPDEEVHVLRDVPEPAANGLALSADKTAASALTVRRLPAVGEPSSNVPLSVPAPQLVEPAHPATPVAAAPESALAVVAPSPIELPRSNPRRAVVPEPQPPIASPTPERANDPDPGRSRSADTPIVPPRAMPAQQPPPIQPRQEPAPVESAQQPVKAIGRAWEEPAFLLAQLERLKKHASAQEWATDVSDELRLLGPAIEVGAAQTADILHRLEVLAQQAPLAAGRADDDALAQDICRAGHALERRVTIYRQIAKMGGMLAADVPAPSVDPREFNKCLNDIDKLTADSSEGRAWRKYLMFDSLRDWAAHHRNGEERLPRDLAQQVLRRINQLSVSSHQRQFLTSGPMAALNREMIRHTAEPVNANRLLKHLETYEQTGLPSDGRVLARDCEYLSVSSGAEQRELGDRVEMHYRNANLRLAVTAEMLNRMMPKREPEFERVHDNIQGAAVEGRSLAASELSVRLIPDPARVHLALVVSGEVAASTRSTAGPATFYTDSDASYIARKPLEVTLRGIRIWPTEVSVDNSSQLRGVVTDFDRVPLAGRIARNVAEQKHDERMPAADAEIREKIAQKARDRVDQEATARVTAAAKRLHDDLLGPMDSLLLDPIMISAETTEKRFNMRVRLAGPDQLGGYTPRPQAPSDSLASLQIHESLLNNVLARLELDGQTFDLAGLNRRLAERLQRFQPRPVDPDQEDVKITFAAKDALHVRCVEGRLEVALAIARLSKGSRHFKNFQVRASYKPEVQGRSVDLLREGIVQLIGPRMNAGAQLCLRGVFLKVFSDQQPIHMSPEAFVKNPKLGGIVVTQFVIDDGWIGAAIGPQATVTAEAPRTAR